MDCRSAGQTVNVNGEAIRCGPEDVLDQATRNVLLRVLDDMQKYVQELLYIVRANSITVTGRWCFDQTISLARYAQPASDFDALMIITAWPTSGGTIAWASGCRSDQFGRSTAGHMNFGPGAVGGRSYKMIYATALHELMHALGFSGNRFTRMLNANGQVFNGVSRINLGDAQAGTKSTTIISSPRVVAEARAHLGCATITGVEIEDDGGSGSGGSHWEQRVVGNEVMAPSIPSTATAQGPLVSRLTLALFEDLGVYYPDYSKVTGNYVYGRGQGCDFYTRPTRERRAQYQCPRTARSNQCHPDLTGFSGCQWQNYGQALPRFEQPDLNNPTQGGNQFSDYAVEASAWTSCRGGTLPTQNGQNGGPNSFCLINSVVQGNFRREPGAARV
jgi:leishmanolysin